MVSVDDCDHDLGNAVYSNWQTIHEKEFVAAQGAMFILWLYRILKNGLCICRRVFLNLAERSRVPSSVRLQCMASMRQIQGEKKIFNMSYAKYAYQATDFPQSILRTQFYNQAEFFLVK